MNTPRMMRTLAACAGAALALTACGGASDKADSADKGAKSDGTITLTVATFNEFGYEGLFEEYMAAHPNIKIEHRKAATTTEARDNLNTRLAAGSGLADIEGVEGGWLPELMQYPDKFVDLTSPEVADRWLEWKTKPATDKDGRLLGYGTDAGPVAVCYRSDLFAKAGLPTDRAEVAKLLEGDWDNYFQVGKQFTEATNVPWFDSVGGVFEIMIAQLPNAFEQADGTPVPLKDNADMKKVYDTLVAQVPLSAKLTPWTEDWTAAFQKDGFGTMFCPSWMIGVVEGNAKGVAGWDVANVTPGGGANSGGSFLMVPTQSAHPEEAKALAAWLTAPEQQIKAFKNKGTFPSQTKGLEDPILLEHKSEFFNNAPVGEIFAERAKAVTVVPFAGPNYFAIRGLVGDALTRVETAVEDAGKSWEKALSEYDALGLN